MNADVFGDFGIPVVEWPEPDVAWLDQIAFEVFGDAVLPHMPDGEKAMSAREFLELVANRDKFSDEQANEIWAAIILPWMLANPRRVPNLPDFADVWHDFSLRALVLPETIVLALADEQIVRLGSFDEAAVAVKFEHNDAVCNAFAAAAGIDMTTARRQVNAYFQAVLLAMFAHRQAWYETSRLHHAATQEATVAATPIPIDQEAEAKKRADLELKQLRSEAHVLADIVQQRKETVRAKLAYLADKAKAAASKKTYEDAVASLDELLSEASQGQQRFDFGASEPKAPVEPPPAGMLPIGTKVRLTRNIKGAANKACGMKKGFVTEVVGHLCDNHLLKMANGDSIGCVEGKDFEKAE